MMSHHWVPIKNIRWHPPVGREGRATLGHCFLVLEDASFSVDVPIGARTDEAIRRQVDSNLQGWRQ
jgi:hypothetical protein